MPPLPLIPGQPTGAVDIYGGGYSPYGYQPQGATSGQSDVDKWIAYSEKAAAAANQASADQNVWEREKLRMQAEDAKKGLQNAMEIARLQSQTSRYGVDQQTQTRLKELQQAQQQFEATHALDMQKFGLDVAEAYTKYASTPDLTFQRADLMNGLQRAGIGQGPSPLSSQGTPVAKTWNDWAALQGWATPAVAAGQTQQPAGVNGAGAGASGGGGSGADPRMAAATSIMKAIPPSDGVGHDESDFAALRAIQSVFSAAKPGSYERLRPGQKAAFASGLSRLGYYAPDALADMKRANPGQQSSRLA